MCSKPPVWKMLSKLTGIKEAALIEDLVPPGNPETIAVPCQRLGIWLVSKRIGRKWQQIQQRSVLAITLLSIFQALLVRDRLLRLGVLKLPNLEFVHALKGAALPQAWIASAMSPPTRSRQADSCSSVCHLGACTPPASKRCFL